MCDEATPELRVYGRRERINMMASEICSRAENKMGACTSNAIVPFSPQTPRRHPLELADSLALEPRTRRAT